MAKKSQKSAAKYKATTNITAPELATASPIEQPAPETKPETVTSYLEAVPKLELGPSPRPLIGRKHQQQIATVVGVVAVIIGVGLGSYVMAGKSLHPPLPQPTITVDPAATQPKVATKGQTPPVGFVAYETPCYIIDIPRDHSAIGADLSCLLTTRYGRDRVGYITVDVFAKNYLDLHEATSAWKAANPSEQIISETSLKVDGREAVNIIHNSGGTSVDQATILVFTGKNGYRVQGYPVTGFEIRGYYGVGTYARSQFDTTIAHWTWK